MRILQAAIAGPLAMAIGSNAQTKKYEEIIQIEVDKFCANEQEITDSENCETRLNMNNKMAPVKKCVEAWLTAPEEYSLYADCMKNNLKSKNEVETAEFATKEFINGISDDAMMMNIAAEVHQLQGVIDASKNLTSEAGRSLGDVAPETVLNAEEQLGQLKRFVELKQLVSWMQPKDKRISRYCFYGCWCLPEGAHSFIAGEGHPVDLVDRACQLFWFCYQCAKQEMTANVAGKVRTCDPEKTKYTFRFKYDRRRPNDYKARDIICKDNWYFPVTNRDKWRSNCAKAFCECDRGIAMRLYQSWKHWDKSRHRIWSQRVTQCGRITQCNAMPVATARQRADREACLKKGCLFIVSERCLYGAGGNNDVDQQPICCGIYEDGGSRFEMRDHGGRFNCCNHNQGAGFGDNLPWNGAWYNTITHCCHNGQVESAGGPNC